jgi:hypothetical protein
MAKTPKAPKFQNLPTLEGLAIRRRQTIASILSDWGVVDANSLGERLKREGLAPVEDAAALFPSKVVTPKPALVELPNKEPEQAQKKNVEPESKKPAKAKLSSDAPDPGPEDRATSKSAVVVSDEAGKPSSKA